VDTRLKAPEVQRILQEAFPGADVRIGSRLGGFIITMTIWHFDLSVSLTSQKVAQVDEPGEMDIRLTYAENVRGRALRLDVASATAKGEADLKKFLEWLRAYLEGIIAAISVAFEKPIDFPPANLFDPRLTK